jgi:ribosomal protein S18 acetylase RimI-like enzyme
MVDGHMHRQGIGSQIFADVRAAMTGQGYDYLSLSCEKENTEAIAFWQAQGFKAAAEDEGCIRFARDI